MNAFDVLPVDFFRILTGKNRIIYTEALLAVRKVFKLSMHIDREALIVHWVERLSELGLSLDPEEEEAEGEPAGVPGAEGMESVRNLQKHDGRRKGVAREDLGTWSGMAHAILRRLVATGWMELENKPQSFEQQVTLPPHVIGFLEWLDQVTRQETAAYRQYAFTTYSALLAMMDPEAREYAYTAFHAACDNSRQLMDSLKGLLGNIRQYHRALGEFVTANDVLKDHFEGYQVLVNERIFHPLVTRDAVMRFKQPVMHLVDRIREDDELMQAIAMQAVSEKRFPDSDSAMESILPELQAIHETFDGIDPVMMEIQTKNSAYTKASTDKLVYLLNQDRSMKEKLASILMQWRHVPEPLRGELERNIRLFRQQVLDEQSLFARASRKMRSTELPETVKDEIPDKDVLAGFLRGTRNRYAHAKVMRFMEEQFGVSPVLPIEDVRVETEDDFILILLAALKEGEPGCFYRVEYLTGRIEKSIWGFPRMRFIRKEMAP